MQFQSHYNRFLLSLEGTKNIYVSFCENIISFCAPRTFRFADYTEATPITELCKRINFALFDYETGEKIKTLNQTTDDESFGKITMNLTKGKYIFHQG